MLKKRVRLHHSHAACQWMRLVTTTHSHLSRAAASAVRAWAVAADVDPDEVVPGTFTAYPQHKAVTTGAVVDGLQHHHTAVGVVAVGYAKPADRPSPSLKRGHRAPADVVRRGRW